MHNISIREEIVERVMKRRGRFHLFDRLDPQRTALVVIDMQATFCQEGAPAEVPGSRDIVAPINRLAGHLRALGGRIIWVNHANTSTPTGTDWNSFFENFVSDNIRERTIASLSPGDPGQELWSELDAHEDDLRIIKNRYSALIPGSSPLERIVRSLGIDTLLIAGTKTNVCCEATARDAMMMDFRVVMLSDATAALSDEEHRATLENIIQQFGDVMTCAEAMHCLDAGRTAPV
ncbi:MAG: cysteine hydrolase [Rhizobiales bacterium]|nr:cysteine hydrolase [Hyphomicrobiales bacterium]